MASRRRNLRARNDASGGRVGSSISCGRLRTCAADRAAAARRSSRPFRAGIVLGRRPAIPVSLHADEGRGGRGDRGARFPVPDDPAARLPGWRACRKQAGTASSAERPKLRVPPVAAGCACKPGDQRGPAPHRGGCCRRTRKARHWSGATGRGRQLTPRVPALHSSACRTMLRGALLTVGAQTFGARSLELPRLGDLRSKWQHLRVGCQGPLRWRCRVRQPERGVGRRALGWTTNGCR